MDFNSIYSQTSPLNYTCFELKDGNDVSLQKEGLNSETPFCEQESTSNLELSQSNYGPICFTPYSPSLLESPIYNQMKASPCSHPGWISPLKQTESSKKMIETGKEEDMETSYDLDLTPNPTGHAAAHVLTDDQSTHIADLFFQIKADWNSNPSLKSSSSEDMHAKALDNNSPTKPILAFSIDHKTELDPFFDHKTRLEAFIDRVKNNRDNYAAYLPARYCSKISEYVTDPAPSFKKWADAMLHNPPQEMLESLDRIQSIFDDHEGNLRCLFPCSFVLSSAFKPKKWNFNIDGLSQFTLNRNYAVLELTFKKKGGPFHIFLRTLKNEPPYLKKHLGNKFSMIIKMLSKSIDKIKPDEMQPITERLIETDHYMVFNLSEDVSIVAAKKK